MGSFHPEAVSALVTPRSSLHGVDGGPGPFSDSQSRRPGEVPRPPPWPPLDPRLPKQRPPPMGGMTWSSSFMLVLFQIFLMMALSSSLACSKLPGDKGQAGAAVLDEATSEPLTQEMSFAFVAAAVLDAGNGGTLSLTPGRPTLGSRTQPCRPWLPGPGGWA